MKQQINIPVPGTETQPILLNREERRKQQKYFVKFLEKHMKRKPSYNIEEKDEEKQKKNMERLLAWSRDYGLILQKLDKLGYEFKKDNEGVHKQNVEYGRQAGPELRKLGEEKIAAMREMQQPTQDSESV